MYVVGFVELSQWGREGAERGNYATLKGILVAREGFFFFFFKSLSLIEA